MRSQTTRGPRRRTERRHANGHAELGCETVVFRSCRPETLLVRRCRQTVLHSRSLAWDASHAGQLDGLTIDASGPIGSFVDPTAQALRTYGFAILKSFDVANELLDDRLTELGSSLGTIVMQSPRGELIEDVRDTSDFDGEVDTRGYRSGGDLVPHSDPPTLIVLHCVTPARSGGESYLVNVSSIVTNRAKSGRSAFGYF